MRRNRWCAIVLAGCLLLALCACSGTNDNSSAPQGNDSDGDAAEVQYDYQLKAGETTGPDVTFNGTVYSKQELVPDDTAVLGIYSVYENDSMSYVKLAIGDDSIETLE